MIPDKLPAKGLRTQDVILPPSRESENFGTAMQLREHPRLYIWPPKFATSLDFESLPLEESEGSILKEVAIRFPLGAREGQDRYIWISVEYGGRNYFGKITTFRDPEFVDLLYQKLRNSIGQTIREIGDSAWEGGED
jgi:hypothetical protein